MERREDGKFKQKIKDEDLIEKIKEKGPRVTTNEVAKEFDVTQRAIQQRLNRLCNSGVIQREQVGGLNLWSL